MKDLKINVPEGYEIDKDKSTFENIVFKKINELPISWWELEYIDGFFPKRFLDINYTVFNPAKNLDDYKNTFKTKEQAKASIALAELSQLRDVYRQGWEPDWKNSHDKFIIEFFENKLRILEVLNTSFFLSFQDRETAELFLENFKDLIEKAKPLMS